MGKIGYLSGRNSHHWIFNIFDFNTMLSLKDDERLAVKYVLVIQTMFIISTSRKIYNALSVKMSEHKYVPIPFLLNQFQ